MTNDTADFVIQLAVMPIELIMSIFAPRGGSGTTQVRSGTSTMGNVGAAQQQAAYVTSGATHTSVYAGSYQGGAAQQGGAGSFFVAHQPPSPSGAGGQQATGGGSSPISTPGGGSTGAGPGTIRRGGSGRFV